MDARDRDILEALRSDARLSYRSLGAQVGLSANAAADRVRRLLVTGVIREFKTVIDETADPEARLDLIVTYGCARTLTRLPSRKRSLRCAGSPRRST